MRPHRLCIAPMMNCSDHHCRYFWRLLTKNALLYTEMVTPAALIHGDREGFLLFNPEEHPVALQLGGSHPQDLARCARWAEEWGYEEVNLNCGCPSDRVQSGMFGACLMAQPALVAECVAAMSANCAIPVTVKHRIGIDDMESYSQLLDFVRTIAAAGCRTFIVHARKAWLRGLSPRENREIPPLKYDWVYRLKQECPQLNIVLNGGINSLDECAEHLRRVDGVMIGREAYTNPYLLAEVDQRLFGSNTTVATREEILLQLLPYVEQHLSRGGQLNYISRHILGLFQNLPGARKFRRHLSENAYKPGAGIEVLEQGLALIRQETERAEVQAAARTTARAAERTAL
ncbi:MAG: tRNA dihydrouridine(20/20a) synthase DusA [Gammaproteobacteria bacterium]|nr:tRNA dihydrouridine(20/20a) synthase DusA [Gammaproteobacteria bacterium]